MIGKFGGPSKGVASFRQALLGAWLGGGGGGRSLDEQGKYSYTVTIHYLSTIQHESLNRITASIIQYCMHLL